MSINRAYIALGIWSLFEVASVVFSYFRSGKCVGTDPWLHSVGLIALFNLVCLALGIGLGVNRQTELETKQIFLSVALSFRYVMNWLYIVLTENETSCKTWGYRLFMFYKGISIITVSTFSVFLLYKGFQIIRNSCRDDSGN